MILKTEISTIVTLRFLIRALFRDLKTDSSHPTRQLERICREELQKNPQIQLRKDGHVIPKETHSCNCCQKCLKKILCKGYEYLCHVSGTRTLCIAYIIPNVLM